jgi:hypothetical protein
MDIISKGISIFLSCEYHFTAKWKQNHFAPNSNPKIREIKYNKNNGPTNGAILNLFTKRNIISIKGTAKITKCTEPTKITVFGKNMRIIHDFDIHLKEPTTMKPRSMSIITAKKELQKTLKQ